MPFEFRVHPKERLVVAVFRGDVTRAELEAFGAALVGHPEFGPDFSSLYDLRELSVDSPGPGALRTVMGRQLFTRGARRAFVVSHELHFGLLRQVELSVDGATGQFGIFATTEEALAWLGARLDP